MLSIRVVIQLAGVYSVYWHKISKLQITPPKIRVRNHETTEKEKVALEYIQNEKIETDDIKN